MSEAGSNSSRGMSHPCGCRYGPSGYHRILGKEGRVPTGPGSCDTAAPPVWDPAATHYCAPKIVYWERIGTYVDHLLRTGGHFTPMLRI
eukprot:352893-Chlamydomonas_euryale.AAC.3